MNEVQQPKYRSPIRQILGKEFYIGKRKVEWILGKTNWAKQIKDQPFHHLVFKHQSMILRPLKDIDMILQENKRTNLRIAIQHLDKIVIKPGETFSIWKNVGRTTKAKGYLNGLVLNQGKIESGIGGGLCQLGNLLFWIFAHSPLTITERHRHGFDVFPDINRKVPFGAGATLSYNYIDLQVVNQTDNEFQVLLFMDENYLYGELYSKNTINSHFEVVEQDHIMKQQFWGGYTRHNRIIQIEKQKNGQQVEKLLAENHAIMMYSPFLEQKSDDV